ncbi:MAG: DNA mismatch repair endonuclease MutL [bacterium]|nr:DNA mismatch repair endonuclease MutL [bacterium]
MSSQADKKLTRRWIRPLPKQVVNKIAAGEVVERPAAVVKELVENSMDAGADRIEIVIEKSGSSAIKIIDNGCGIDADQIEIAFSRHATSKISGFDDLNDLATYGFRGEALPSIASVAQFRMVSRTTDADVGQEIIIEGGVLQGVQPIAAQVGTQVEIKNLFFNTPARRKFLKSETTEARHISRVATALALGRPDIGFTYTLNGRKIFTLPSGQSSAERVASVLAPRERFLPVQFEGEQATIEGFVGPPQLAQNNRQSLYLFINNRFIQSATLAHGVMSGYGELLPPRKFPVGAVHIKVNAGEVDVNVHPTKIEVRLAAEREIHDLIHRAVKEALRSDGIIPTFRSSANAHSPSSSPSGNSASSSHGGRIRGIGSPQPVNHQFFKELFENPQAGSVVLTSSSENDQFSVNKETGEIIETGENLVGHETASGAPAGPTDGFRLIGRFSNLYLILQVGTDLYIVDQHTAHERVLYEEMVRRVDEQSVNGQQLLFPVQVELSPTQMAVYVEAADLFNSSGFTISEFGGTMVNVEAVPVILAKKSPEKILLKVIDDFASLRKSGLDLKKAMAQSMACRAAVMSGDRLNDKEAEFLIESLLQCENAYACPHGRPTFIKLTRDDLDKQFGRG